MINVTRTRLIKVIVSIIILLLLILSILLKLLLSDSSYNIPQVKMSATLVDKLQQGRKEGSVLEINKDEFNQIISMYAKEGKIVKGILIKGAYGEILDSNVKFYVPCSYKGISFLFTSEGALTYKDNKLIYKPLYFKIGKVSLPKNLIINGIENYAKGKISVKAGDIIIDSSTFPVKIKSLEVKKNLIYISIEKIAVNLEAKLKSIANDKSSLEGQKEAKSNSEQTNNGAKTDESYKENKGSGQTTSEMDAALDRINAGLSSAEGSVNTGAQKAVISEMISAIDSMKGNPNVNPYNYAGGVRSLYGKLSPQEKSQLKTAVFSNVNGNDINIVSNILGK